jgi:hypothetical protein
VAERDVGQYYLFPHSLLRRFEVCFFKAFDGFVEEQAGRAIGKRQAVAL